MQPERTKTQATRKMKVKPAKLPDLRKAPPTHACKTALKKLAQKKLVQKKSAGAKAPTPPATATGKIRASALTSDPPKPGPDAKARRAQALRDNLRRRKQAPKPGLHRGVRPPTAPGRLD